MSVEETSTPPTSADNPSWSTAKPEIAGWCAYWDRRFKEDDRPLVLWVQRIDLIGWVAGIPGIPGAAKHVERMYGHWYKINLPPPPVRQRPAPMIVTD